MGMCQLSWAPTTTASTSRRARISRKSAYALAMPLAVLLVEPGGGALAAALVGVGHGDDPHVGDIA